MTLFSLTVVRNEADRYLRSMLANVVDVVDWSFVYDDQSDDNTLEIVQEFTPEWWVREEGTPSFLEHEGKMRQDAWDVFEMTMQPKLGDWVLAIDADEMLVTTSESCCVRCELDQAIGYAHQEDATAIVLPIPEVFGVDDDGTPLVRTDGWWGKIAGSRLFRYEKDGVFPDKPMASGSEPSYVEAGRCSRRSLGLHLMHFGYMDKRDQQAKWERYTALMDHGHSNQHVQSIVSPPTLKRWSSTEKLERA
jgi:hypothetical protein